MSVPSATLSSNSVVLALLGSRVLPARSEPYERVSAAISVREALTSRKAPKTVLFLVPEGTSSTGRYILAGLLAANYAHANGFGRLPANECISFLKSQVLLVTPAVSECIDDLEALRLVGTTPLTELWDILPLARQTPKASTKQRVFVSNPGWALRRLTDRRYSAVIIDATHPRTLAPLGTLIELGRKQSALCIVVCPVLPASMLAELNKPDIPDTWLWDPQAKLNALNAINDAKRTSSPPASHHLHVCDEDSEADRLLGEAYNQIAIATRLAAGTAYAGLPLVRYVLNRLRALTVPLNTYEQAAAKTWAGGLASRIRMLGSVAGHGQAAWDATWPRVSETLTAAYEAFVRRVETAKFWALAERLQVLLRTQHSTYRLVAPSEVEADLLTSWLQDVVDNVPEAIGTGRLEIVTHADEARCVAHGLLAHTLLLGPRPWKYRYLSLYPSQPHEQFVYPFEASVEHTALCRQYEAVVPLQSNRREALLERLQLGLLTDVASVPSPPPQVDTTRADGRPVQLTPAAAVGVSIELDFSASDDSDARMYATIDRGGLPRSGELLEVVYSDGQIAHYAIEELVDVYYPETDDITRVAVTDLTPGLRIIRFVDSQYDSLFQRTTEAIKKKLPTQYRMLLELWDISKKSLARSHASKQDLYSKLRAAGLKSSYATFCSWFRDDSETIAPQQQEDFVVLAKVTQAFKSDSLVRDTFKCVQKIRGRHRSAGRQLRALLRAVISRDGYEEALDSVRKVDPDLADVYAAVDVVEVQSVRRS